MCRQLASRVAAVAMCSAQYGEDPFEKFKELIQNIIGQLEAEATSEAAALQERVKQLEGVLAAGTNRLGKVWVLLLWLDPCSLMGASGVHVDGNVPAVVIGPGVAAVIWESMLPLLQCFGCALVLVLGFTAARKQALCPLHHRLLRWKSEED